MPNLAYEFVIQTIMLIVSCVVLAIAIAVAGYLGDRARKMNPLKSALPFFLITSLFCMLIGEFGIFKSMIHTTFAIISGIMVLLHIMDYLGCYPISDEARTEEMVDQADRLAGKTIRIATLKTSGDTLGMIKEAIINFWHIFKIPSPKNLLRKLRKK